MQVLPSVHTTSAVAFATASLGSNGEWVMTSSDVWTILTLRTSTVEGRAAITDDATLATQQGCDSATLEIACSAARATMISAPNTCGEKGGGGGIGGGEAGDGEVGGTIGAGEGDDGSVGSGLVGGCAGGGGGDAGEVAMPGGEGLMFGTTASSPRKTTAPSPSPDPQAHTRQTIIVHHRRPQAGAGLTETKSAAMEVVDFRRVEEEYEPSLLAAFVAAGATTHIPSGIASALVLGSSPTLHCCPLHEALVDTS